MSVHIKVIFFKETGKYYTEEDVYTNTNYMEDLKAELLYKYKNKYTDMYIYVDTKEHPNGYPLLILPTQR